MRNDVVGSVKFSLRSVLAPWHDPSDAVVKFKGRVFAYEEKTDQLSRAGTLRGWMVRSSEAEQRRFRLSTVADAHSQELCEVVNAVFDDDDEPRAELGIDSTTGHFIFLKRMNIKRRYRSKGLAAQAIRTAIAAFCPLGLLVAPKDLDVPSADRLALGMKSIAGTELMLWSNANRRPDEASSDV